MFAFAIWDVRKTQLFLARDRIGIKPLYYFYNGVLFSFASEISSIITLSKKCLSLNATGLAFYSTLGYIPAPHTVYREITKLEPGHYILVQNNKLIKTRYWQADFSYKENRSLETLLHEIPIKLGNAVCDHLVSDVPVGAFLSGGIDSSTVVALMSRGTDERIKTFSIGFQENAFDERPFAKIVAEHCKTEHYEFQIPTTAPGGILPTLVRHFGEPFADSSALPTWYLSQMTRQYVKVALSGDGGDELFCGYTVYLGHQFSQLYRLLPLQESHLLFLHPQGFWLLMNPEVFLFRICN